MITLRSTARGLLALAQATRAVATLPRVPIMSVPAAVAAGLGRFLWQGQPDTIDFAAIEGMPVAKTTGVQATVSGYPAYVAALHDASVTGQSSAVFGLGGEILSDTYADARYGDAVDLRADTVVRLRYRDTALLDLPKPTRRIEQAINLTGLASNHFGHWIAEFLTRLRHIVQLPELTSTPILVNADMPESHFEFLGRLCDNPVLRISRDEVIKVGTLIVAPTISFFPFDLKPGHSVPIENQSVWSAPAMRFLRDKVLATVDDPTPTTRDAIYLSRENSTWGRPFNEDALLACCTALELRPVRLESMDFAEQVATIRRASTIVAPTGSALNMLIFARRETRLIILTQRYPHNWGGWVGPLREIGLDPCMIMSAMGDPVVKHARFEIDIDGLSALLNSE
jgi:capsular polysaccharide biosynthesis protein